MSTTNFVSLGTNIAPFILHNSIMSAQYSKPPIALEDHSVLNALLGDDTTKIMDELFNLINQIDDFIFKVNELPLGGDEDPVFLTLRDLFVIRSIETEFTHYSKLFERLMKQLISKPHDINRKQALKLRKKLDVLERDLSDLEIILGVFETDAIHLIGTDINEQTNILNQVSRTLFSGIVILNDMIERLKALVRNLSY